MLVTKLKAIIKKIGKYANIKTAKQLVFSPDVFMSKIRTVPLLCYMAAISDFLQFCAAQVHKIQNFSKKQYYSDLPLAVYDLRCSPVTYDFGYFLYEVDSYFKEKGYNQFNVIVFSTLGKEISTAQAPGYDNYNKIVTYDHQLQRVFNIIMPLASLYKSCVSINLISDINLVAQICRSHLNVYPEHYDGLFLRTISYNKIFDYERKQTQLSGLKAFELDLDKVTAWLLSENIKQPFVTFTIRHYGFQVERNSNISAYLEFVKYLESLGIASIFIPDTEDISYINQISQYPIFFAGAFNIYQRQAIYELAMTNIFNSNGCHVLCSLNKSCSYIMSGITNKYWTREAHEARGLRYGSQPFCDSRGVWEWESETFASLKKSFGSLLEKNPSWLTIKRQEA